MNMRPAYKEIAISNVNDLIEKAEKCLRCKKCADSTGVLIDQLETLRTLLKNLQNTDSTNIEISEFYAIECTTMSKAFDASFLCSDCRIAIEESTAKVVSSGVDWLRGLQQG